MILYHGSSFAGIESLRPFASNHEKPYVYLTQSQVLATVYAHNPLTRPNGFFSYWWRKDGVLCYDEYFENQLEEIYSGQQGFVYVCEGDFPHLEKMPWVYLAEENVPVQRRIDVPDIYQQLLQYETDGLLKVQRWHEVSDRQKEIWENVVRNSLTHIDLASPDGAEYYAYVKAHFKNIDQHSKP